MRSASSGLAAQTVEGLLLAPVPSWAIDAIDAVAIRTKATMLCARFIRLSVAIVWRPPSKRRVASPVKPFQLYESSTSRTFLRNTSLARYIVVTIVESGT
jgi:hypothetical protein